MIQVESPKPDLTKPFCYYIDETQDPTLTCGWVPSVVVKDEWGHWPLTGKPGGEAPWVWGATLEEAKSTCDEHNRMLGLSEEEVNKIVLSSMFANDTPSVSQSKGGGGP